jgi:hypothetical protein
VLVYELVARQEDITNICKLKKVIKQIFSTVNLAWSVSFVVSTLDANKSNVSASRSIYPFTVGHTDQVNSRTPIIPCVPIRSDFLKRVQIRTILGRKMSGQIGKVFGFINNTKFGRSKHTSANPDFVYT